MKKLILSTIIVLCLFSLAGCKNKELSITAQDVTVNTLLAKSNGELQVAYVEDFDKEHYRLSELEEFVKQEVDDYNSTIGSEVVTIQELKVRDGKAIMLLAYTGMEHYAKFNNVWAAYFNSGITDIPEDIPNNLITAKDGTPVDKNTVLQSQGLKVLAVTEVFEIIVDGDIKYLTSNAVLEEKNRIRSTSEELTVVVFKK